MTEFTRPRDGARFTFAGLKTNVQPDALQPGKFALAQNIRATNEDSLVTRPGQQLLFTTASSRKLTDLRTYAALDTDDLPRLLARDVDDIIWLDTGAQVGTLAPGGLGACMLPFRPNASPTPWMYIANGADYQKLSAPGALDAVTQAKVGIAEPQTAPEAFIASVAAIYVDAASDVPPFTPSGTMGAISATARISDTVVAVFPDPAAAAIGGSRPTTLQTDGTVQYQRFMKLMIGAAANERFVQDVFTPIPASFLSSIYYFSGTTGRCVVVPGGPAGFAQGPGSSGDSLYGAQLLSGLRRGALVQIGSEVCFVLSTTEGPGGTICFETTTTAAHTASESLIGVPAIQVFDAQTTLAADALTSPDYSAAVTVGIGQATATLGSGTSEQLRPTAYINPSPFLVIAPNLPWANPASAFDGDPTTFSSSALTELLHSSVQWNTWPAPGFTYASVNLYIDSEVPAPTGGGAWGAALQYSTDAGATWNDVYRTGGTGGAGARIRQTDIVSLPPGVNITTDLIVHASLDTLHGGGASMRVYDINTIGIATGPFTSPFILQPEDYVHVSINVDDLTKLNEMKLIFEIDTDNFYYYTVRPSDLAAAVANSQTQIAAAQTVEQRAIIDQLNAAAANNQGQTASSAQTPPGSSQWAEILFPISAFTRVGNDQTKSLSDAAHVVLLFNASATINVLWNSIFVFGGFQPDVGDIGAPYLYRVRPRSKMTGVVGNPSPATRYGCSPRRQEITVSLPDATYDPQIDTWDIFRYGGSVTSWRYIGSTPSNNTIFPDNYDDTSADAGNALDFDNFEPWPTVDLPNNGTALYVTGTTAIVSSADPDITRYLPGTLVQLGGLNVYTLWARPTLISGSDYLLQFVENAGAGMSIPYAIQEPALARQTLPYLWGPDANGTVFACGDSFRPGTLYYAKPNAPDSAPDSYNTEITPPSEPLLGGEVLDGLSLVASSNRWWALYPKSVFAGVGQSGIQSQNYNIVQQPIPRGLAAPLGHCTDGVQVFFWAKDGIWSSTKGSLTDADLYNLFPHDGVAGVAVSYNGTTIQPPDYRYAGGFRLTYSNGYLYAPYQDVNGTYRCLVLDLKRMAWSVDAYTPAVSAFCHPDQQAGTVLSTAARYGELYMGTVDGRGALQTASVNDLGGAVLGLVALGEFDGGDLRAPKQWGDGFLDLVPAALAGVIATPMSLGAAAAAATTIPPGITRLRTPISVGGVIVSDFLGLQLAWTDDFSTQAAPTQLFIWQPSFTVQPARTLEWFTFGTAFGQDGYMHIREIAVAYVAASPITLTITSFDGQSPAPVTLPATAGVYQKVMIPLTANKGQLYRFAASSAGLFQFFFDDFEVHVGQWRRQGAYASVRGFGGRVVDASPI